MPASATKLVAVKRHHLALNDQHLKAPISVAARVDVIGSGSALQVRVTSEMARTRITQSSVRSILSPFSRVIRGVRRNEIVR